MGADKHNPTVVSPQLLPPPPPGHVLSAWASTDYFSFSAEGHPKLVVVDLSCTTPFSCPYPLPTAESLPRTQFCKARINSREAPLNANDRLLAPLPPNPHPNFSPRAQTPPAAIDVKRASASPAQPDSTWGEEGNLKGPVVQGLLEYRRKEKRSGIFETVATGRITGETFRTTT